jgi:hypothetical protein
MRGDALPLPLPRRAPPKPKPTPGAIERRGPRGSISCFVAGGASVRFSLSDWLRGRREDEESPGRWRTNSTIAPGFGCATLLQRFDVLGLSFRRRLDERADLAAKRSCSRLSTARRCLFLLRSPNSRCRFFGSISAAVDSICGMVWVWMWCAPDNVRR